MHHLMDHLWADDRGALLSIEFLLIATILILGLIVAFSTLRNAITAEFAELGNALLTLSQGYSVGGLSGGSASVDGSQAFDTPGTGTPPVATGPASIAVIDVTTLP